jgi:transposase
MNERELPGLDYVACHGPEPALNAGSAAPRLKPIDRSQFTWRMVDVESLIEQDHPARAIWVLTGRLSLEAFYAPIKTFEGEAGRPPWDPRLMISLWLYAYSRGISSAREVERRCEHDPAFQWLCGLGKVNYHTLSDFRVAYQRALQKLFVDVLAVLSAEGLISLERVMHDGTKIRSDAGRQSFRTQKTLRQHLQSAREHVEALSREQTDDSARHKAAQQRAAQEREQRVQQALKQLEQIRGSRSKEQPRASLSDPDARIMKQPAGGYAPSYNVQISTEASHKIVVAVDVAQQGNDYEQLSPALEHIRENLEATPKQVVVDGGFTSRANVNNITAQGVDLVGSLPEAEGQSAASVARGYHTEQFRPEAFEYDPVQNLYRCPAGKVLSAKGHRPLIGVIQHIYQASRSDCQACPFKTQCCPRSRKRTLIRQEEQAQILAFRQKMQTPQAQQIYKQRAEVAEFPNAWIKEKLGLRRFRVRSLLKVKCEALWAVLTYNIQQWIRICWLPKLTNV